MAETVQFTYTLPGDNELDVTATVTPGRPELAASLNNSGEPAEDPDVEITECYLKDAHENVGDLPFEPEGLYLRTRDGKFIEIVSDMEERAWDVYSVGG
jgi:hypothetical protein